MKTSTAHKISRMPARIVCQYVNQSEQVQVICIAGTGGVSFEKTVLPQQQIVFEAPSESVLEVNERDSGTAASAANRIPCIRLRINVNADKSEGLEKARTKRKKTAKKKATKRATNTNFKQLSA